MPDSIKLAIAPALLLPLVILLLLLTGCAVQPEQPASSADLEGLLGRPPAGAFYRDGKLLLQYGTGKEAVYLGAAWPVKGPGPDQHSYHTAVIDLLTEPAPDSETLRRDWQEVTLFDQDRWKSFVRALLEKLVPDNQASETLVTIQGMDFALNRDQSDKLLVYRLENKPASLQITHSISEASLSAQANIYLREQLEKDGILSGPVLFVVGEDVFGSAFVLFDFARNQSVFITQPASPLPFDQKLGYSLRLVDALTLRSHILTALRNPLSVTGRLVWLTAQSGAVLLPHGMGNTDEPPSLLAGQQEMDPTTWEQQLDQLVGKDQYRGSMKPLIDGEAFFVSLVQAIQEARESIDIQLYIFDSDDYALRIADMLKKRSREIKVRVLVDNLGSIAAGQVPAKSPYYSRRKPPLSIANYLQQDSAIEVRSVDNPWLTSDHTKVIVIDHRKAYIGGMNIGREYRYEWHDMMTEVEGSIVGRLQKDFDKHWAYAGVGGDLAFALANMKPEQHAGPAEREDYIDIRPLYTRTGDPQILRAQLAAIRNARSYIYVEQAYVSDDEVISELIEARRRGVDVRVILPTRNDSGFMDSANLVAAKAFINNGIRVYGYPGMTHVKAAIYDGWACLGSANFDKLSLRINQETDLATSDPGFVGQLRHDLFEADFARSKEWTEAQPVKWTDYISEFIADQL
jgi:cardiolipin synthase